MKHIQPTLDQSGAARLDRARTIQVIHDLEQALASASFGREVAWGRRVADCLLELKSALRETRDTADAQGGLWEELVQDCPRLQGRTERLRRDYDALREQVAIATSNLCEKPASTSDDVAHLRQELANLLARVRHTQADETELLFEAYQLDIGVGD